MKTQPRITRRDSTIAAGIASATDGALRAAISVVPANGDYLTAQGPLDVADFATIPAATSIENSSIGLDGTITYQNWPGLTLFTNITGGNGGFSTPTANSQFPVFDNLDFTVTASQIPEPGTILLLGSGLFGLAVFGRRKFFK